MKRICAVIPARYASSRFPGKPLVEILGRCMILRVADITAQAVGADNVLVATDDDRIAAVVADGGYTAVMTSEGAFTGTDRVYEVALRHGADVYVNVQGDEPMLDPADIRRVIDRKLLHPDEVVNAMCPIGPDEDPANVNIPKVVFSDTGRLIYMSRLPIPGSKKPEATREHFKQICIYAFTRQELERFAGLGRRGRLEAAEDIEILRFLELDVPVRMVRTSGATLAVDVPSDVQNVERALEARGDG